MTEDTGSYDLRRLLRWRDAGATWRVLAIRKDAVTIALCRCDDEAEEVERLTSGEPDLISFVRAHPDPDSDWPDSDWPGRVE